MELTTYLTFDGTARDALDFYVAALGAEIVMISPYSDMPDSPDMPPLGAEHANRILHARIRLGGQIVMISDSFPGQSVSHGGFSLSLGFDDAEAAKGAFEALSEGGAITMPLARTFWAELFGMCRDRFGVAWMINVEGDAA